MTTGEDNGVEIIEAHQDLVRHIERGARMMKVLSMATILVAAVLVTSYLSQLLLPLTGTTEVTVNLTDPANEAVELLVLALALVWLYVGGRDLAFSWRMARVIKEARRREKELGIGGAGEQPTRHQNDVRGKA